MPFLGSLPLDIRIREQADSGRPDGVADPDGPVAQIYRDIARKVAVSVAQKAEDFSAQFPNIVDPEHVTAASCRRGIHERGEGRVIDDQVRPVDPPHGGRSTA